jgi:CTP synthase
MNSSHPHPKYIFVVGGVMSGVGKGIATASLGAVLQSKGYRVTLMKADPYLNVDAGTMNPTEHGEVFVLDSGLETDQDMGNYERFMHQSFSAANYMTNGMVFKYVIDKERALGYGGKCVEPTFHITEEIIRRIHECVSVNTPEILIMEIGGTVGEYQNAIFLEAARQLKITHPRDVMFIMVSYLPTPKKLGEMKTKPTQNAIRQLNSYGIHPDAIIARSDTGIDEKRKEKIALMSGVRSDLIISAPDVDSIYDVPVNFDNESIAQKVLGFFDLTPRVTDLIEWRDMVTRRKEADRPVRIALVGKYFDSGDYVLSDAYLSVIEALKISAAALEYQPILTWVNAKEIEEGTYDLDTLRSFDGIVVPGGFGESGIRGKLAVIEYARTHKIPYFGLCYGMQLIVIEYARNVLNMPHAHTTEIDSHTPHPIITIMEDQKHKLAQGDFGGSMRLGAYPCMITPETHAARAYGADKVTERHRHRYEVNPEYISLCEKGGLVFSGKSPDGQLMEIVELPESVHPFFLGTQFHPEFLARPLAPHPLFTAFIRACKK